MISRSAEEYLETIYRLEGEGEGGLVPLATLAEHLAVSAVSANQMVRRLEERGFLTYIPYQGVALSEEGRARAASLIRRHRLWERFLADVLGLPWEEVHQEACRLEHATSPLVEAYLARFLEEPQTCPHGYPVPDEEGAAAATEGLSLMEVRPGTKAQVVQVPERDPQLLRYLGQLGLSPGAEVEVEAHAPFGGVLTLRVGGVRHAVGREVAERVRVRLLAPEERP
ncbi:MAG: metal-dependent transcriptional regulator [Anaerolineae bacterium]|nr:metal-dependent transcriptional regulator [Anaerolineae bacterium]